MFISGFPEQSGGNVLGSNCPAVSHKAQSLVDAKASFALPVLVEHSLESLVVSCLAASTSAWA